MKKNKILCVLLIVIATFAVGLSLVKTSNVKNVNAVDTYFNEIADLNLKSYLNQYYSNNPVDDNYLYYQTELDFSHDTINLFKITTLEGLNANEFPFLETLNLADNDISSIDRDIFEKMPSLKTLNLSGNSLEELNLRYCKAETIDLSNNKLTSVNISSDTFTNKGTVPENLQFLNLSNNQFTAIDKVNVTELSTVILTNNKLWGLTSIPENYYLGAQQIETVEDNKNLLYDRQYFYKYYPDAKEVASIKIADYYTDNEIRTIDLKNMTTTYETFEYTTGKYHLYFYKSDETRITEYEFDKVVIPNINSNLCLLIKGDEYLKVGKKLTGPLDITVVDKDPTKTDKRKYNISYRNIEDEEYTPIDSTTITINKKGSYLIRVEVVENEDSYHNELLALKTFSVEVKIAPKIGFWNWAILIVAGVGVFVGIVMFTLKKSNIVVKDNKDDFAW